MKKILAVLLLLAMMFVITSCGNKDYSLGGFRFRCVHVSDCSGNCRDFHIKSWQDDTTGIELNTVEAGRMFLSEGTYILFESEECPICHSEE